jgi:molybdopterin-guanine dinucleotide biosynthesis protein A
MRNDVAAIVLAGGAGRRLGARPAGGKAALEAGGRTFLDRVVAAVTAEAARVIVVAAPGQPLPELATPVEIVRDTAAGSGPLAALRDGLVALAAAGREPRAGVVVACDAPFVRPAVLRLLVRRLEEPGAWWVVPEIDGEPQVLCSAFAPAAVAALVEARLAAGARDVRGLLAAAAGHVVRIGAAEIAAVDPGLESFLDVDTPEDLDRLRARKIPPS